MKKTKASKLFAKIFTTNNELSQITNDLYENENLKNTQK